MNKIKKKIQKIEKDISVLEDKKEKLDKDFDENCSVMFRWTENGIVETNNLPSNLLKSSFYTQQIVMLKVQLIELKSLLD